MARIREHSLLVQTFIQTFCLFMTVSASSLTLFPEERDIIVQIGQPLQITAEATDCDEPSFTWSNLMDKTLSGIVSTKGHVSNLTMAEVTVESEGRYLCKVFCKQGKSERDVRISPYSFPSDPILKSSTLVSGLETTITCSVPHVYPAEMMTINILVDKKKVPNSEPTLADMNEIQNISVSYSWVPTEDNDGNEVECEALLEFSDMDPKIRTSNMTLSLPYSPEELYITVHPSTEVKLMETIYLSCQVGSKSTNERVKMLPVIFQWMKVIGDKTFDWESEGDGKLTIYNATIEDAGRYICYVGVKSALVDITVQNIPEIPRIDINPKTSVILGQPFQIECYGNEDSSTNVTLWSLSESENKLLMDKEGVFEIHSAEVEDGATYLCRAENRAGKAEATKQVIVQYPPRNTVLSYVPTDLKEGDTVTLTCTSDAVPAPEFFIYQQTSTGELMLLAINSDSILSVPELILKRKDDTDFKVFGGELHIDSVALEQAGTYICESRNIVGYESTEMTLSVQAPPKDTQLVIMPSTLLNEGDSVSFSCRSIGYPTPNLTLKKKTDNGLQELDMRNGTYHIDVVSVEQEGTYTCESKNSMGFESTETTLNVQVPPKNTELVILPSAAVREGEWVHILCKSTASPPPVLVLRKKTDEAFTYLTMIDGQHNIGNVELSDSGTYVCESWNEVGADTAEATLNVQVPPKHTQLIITPSASVKEQETVHILCTSTASPAPELILKRKDDTDFKVFGGELHIDSVALEQAGTYICESRNIVGYESTEMTLSVQALPENTTVVVKPSENITEGDTVTITCQTSNSPSPTILLKKACAGNNLTLEAQNGTFTLQNVTLNDTGSYIVTLINKAGNTTKFIEINVQERQQSPKYSYIIPTVLLSVAVVSAGAIGVVIYRLKQGSLKGSYSLVEALKSKV